MSRRQPSSERVKAMRHVLRYFAYKTPAALDQMMRSGSPELACGAAHLLLDGHEFGAWKARPADLKLARKLVAKSKPVVKSKREAKSMSKPMQPLTWDDLGLPASSDAPVKAGSRQKSSGSGDPWPKLKAALQAHRHMLFVLCDSSSLPRARIAAIAAWVEALDAAGMSEIADDDFRVLLLAAERAIKNIKQETV